MDWTLCFFCFRFGRLKLLTNKRQFDETDEEGEIQDVKATEPHLEEKPSKGIMDVLSNIMNTFMNCLYMSLKILFPWCFVVTLITILNTIFKKQR